MVRMDFSGVQIVTLLYQQWAIQPFPRILKPSGISYRWNPAAGGHNFTVLPSGTNRVIDPVDLDALVDYIAGLPQPFSAAIVGRIQLTP